MLPFKNTENLKILLLQLGIEQKTGILEKSILNDKVVISIITKALMFTNAACFLLDDEEVAHIENFAKSNFLKPINLMEAMKELGDNVPAEVFDKIKKATDEMYGKVKEAMEMKNENTNAN